MILFTWMYVILTAFEPPHPKAITVVKWGKPYKALFGIESIILSGFLIDLLASIYHNYFERKFKNLKDHERLFIKQQLSEYLEHKEDIDHSNESENNENPLENRSKIHLRALEKAASDHHHLTEEKDNPHNFNKTSTGLHGMPTMSSTQPTSCWTPIKLFFATLLLESDIRYKLLLFLAFFVDFVLFNLFYSTHISYYRYSKILRVVAFPLFSMSIRRSLQAVYFSIKKIIDFFIFFSVIVALFAGLGYKIFQDPNPTYIVRKGYDKHISDFTSYGIIANSLIILATFDNYPSVMRPFIEESMWYLLYFMPYILLNILFFIPIPIAIVYDGFRDKRSQLTLQDNLREKEALFVCYLTLTQGESHSLGFKNLETLLDKVYSGRLSREQIKKIFHHLDSLNKGKFVNEANLRISTIF